MQEPMLQDVNARDRDFIQSIAKGLLVLRTFSADRPTATLAEMARETGLSRAAVRRILLTFQSLGYVEASGRQYRPLPKILDLGYSLVSSGGLSGLIRPHLEVLNAEIDESCSAGVMADGDVVYVARVQTRRLLTVVAGLGSRLSATSTAMGRALLSSLDDDEVREYIATYPPKPLTPMTIIDPDGILEKVREVRVKGFTISDQEIELGYRGVGVSVRSADGTIRAAISSGIHVSRVTMERIDSEIVPAMQRAAAAIERDLALHPMPF